jgi:hypothetical protein
MSDTTSFKLRLKKTEVNRKKILPNKSGLVFKKVFDSDETISDGELLASVKDWVKSPQIPKFYNQ